MHRLDSRSRSAGDSLRSGSRLLAFWPVKLVGLTLGMTTFFVLYFWILRHPGSIPREMPLTAVDRWIKFSPLALPFYLSLWIYVSLAPALLGDRRALIAYGVSALLLASAGLLIFFLWPTAVPVMEVDWSRYPAFAFLKTVDATGNACPSLHAAFAVFTAIWIGRICVQMDTRTLPRLFNFLWCAAILYSTLATRQHVLIDVLSGVAMGGIAGVWGPALGRPAQGSSSESGGGITQR